MDKTRDIGSGVADARASEDVIEPRLLHIEVAKKLRELIYLGELIPGQRLNERQLTEKFTVSRTPVREAVRMLSRDGLVKLLPNRGAVVMGLTRADARDMFELMSALEALAGELACKRATDRDIEEVRELHEQMRVHYERRELLEYFRLNQRIHEKIVDCTRNAELAEVYRKTSVRIRSARYFANFSHERWDQAMQEHEQILAALTKRDSRRLKRLLTAHLKNKFRALEPWLPEAGDFTAPARPRSR